MRLITTQVASYPRMRNSYLPVSFGMLVTTVGGNPLGPRFSGLVYGLALGLLVAAYSKGIAMNRYSPYFPAQKPLRTTIAVPAVDG